MTPREVKVLLGPGRGHRFRVSGWRMAAEVMAGRYEPAVAGFLRAALPAARTFVDVGGHTGYFARIALNLMPSDGVVVIFEPDMRCASELRSLASGRVAVRMHALGATDSHAELLAEPGKCGQLKAIGDASTSSVQVRTLDNLLRTDCVPPPDVMKVDVEGWELEVLAGASGALRRIKAIAVECHSMPNLRDVLGVLLAEFDSVQVTAGGDDVGPPTVLARRLLDPNPD